MSEPVMHKKVRIKTDSIYNITATHSVDSKVKNLGFKSGFALERCEYKKNIPEKTCLKSSFTAQLTRFKTFGFAAYFRKNTNSPIVTQKPDIRL